MSRSTTADGGRRKNHVNFAASPRSVAAVAAGKLTSVATRSLGRGGGAALPGLIATRLQPVIVRELASQLAGGSVIISGTNGKTTTSRMLATIFEAGGTSVLRNATGSNLTRGIASALVSRVNLLGRIDPRSATVGLFEVDEAALPEVVQLVEPTTLLLLNLFRDQLDRYGEVATVARLWSTALKALGRNARIVANADDPLVAEVASASGCETTYFGVDASSGAESTIEHASDVKTCPRCGGAIAYVSVTLGHLGDYACTHCSFRRPETSVWARSVNLLGISGSRFVLHAGADSAQVHLPLPGMYNVYNAVAAATVALRSGADLRQVADSLAGVSPAFGRMERLDIEGRTVYLALAKNPTGLNEVLRTVGGSDSKLRLLVMLNDNAADGRDVSWIWDADIEMLTGKVQNVIFSGVRAEDMALRFKYAGVTWPLDGVACSIEPESGPAFERALQETPPGETLFIVPTYTAMLDIRSVLARLGHVRPYWSE